MYVHTCICHVFALFAIYKLFMRCFCLHAQVVLTVAIAFIVEAFVHKFQFTQFTNVKGVYVCLCIMHSYVCKLSYRAGWY